MRVTMIDSEATALRSGEPPRHFRAGETYDIPADIARRWIEKGICEKPGSSDEYDLPPGYEARGGTGGYYELYGPDGLIEGPSNGKFQGMDATAEAAHRHHENESATEDTEEE